MFIEKEMNRIKLYYIDWYTVRHFHLFSRKEDMYRYIEKHLKDVKHEVFLNTIFYDRHATETSVPLAGESPKDLVLPVSWSKPAGTKPRYKTIEFLYTPITFCEDVIEKYRQVYVDSYDEIFTSPKEVDIKKATIVDTKDELFNKLNDKAFDKYKKKYFYHVKVFQFKGDV